MSATSPLAAIGALAIALATVHLLQLRYGAPRAARYFGTLDGLRGYAAFLVFLHHSAIWYFYARTGSAGLPPSRLYTHFGQSSVAIFFMVTGLLFWSKLIDARARPLAWLRLYVSRVLRLTPLYLFVVALLWVVALATSGLRLRVSVPRAILQTGQWLTFTIGGMPDLNRAPTSMFGGPVWSLPYEWWFYLSLPAAALLLSRRPPRAWLLLGIAGAAGGSVWISARSGWAFAAAFLGGIASAYLVRQPGLCRMNRHPAAAVACVACVAWATRFPVAFSAAPLVLLSIAFAIIACGNTLFGALEWPAARGLGEMGYSLYLLHAIILYVVFGVVLGTARVAALSLTAHWLVVYACIPVVVAASYATFRGIEAPGMAAVDRVTAFLETAFGRRAPSDRQTHPTVA